MIDAGKLQEELKELDRISNAINDKLCSPDFRKELFEKPLETLKREGIVVPKENEHAIVEFFKSVKVPEGANLRIASDLLQRPRIGISISIGIRF